jgi:predicted unusual protein kinase regulating ubiquinone biosynthesis (AarF/ABC1/UbiB family)
VNKAIELRHKMGILIRPEHLKRYRDIAWLLMKYGRADLVKSAGLDDALGEVQSSESGLPAKAEELAADIEKLGPTYIKLAQLLSTRADLIPQAYLEALERLQDKVEPFSFAEVEKILASELGVRLSKAFAEFESRPLAAASLGQVHRAHLRDGRPVVVKIQRPGLREKIIEDMSALEEIATFLDEHTEMGKRYGFSRILDEFRRSLLRELDYRLEARNLQTFADNLREFESLVVPLPVDDYTTSTVLTMDYVRGKKVTELSPLARIELDGFHLAEHLFQGYLQQILVDGFFHADPHPGNVFLTDDGRIALIDLGMVAHVSPRFQENLLQLLLEISDGRGDVVADIAIKMGEPKQDFDAAAFRHRVADLVAQHHSAKLENISAGRVVLQIAQISGASNFRLPAEFTMISKTLLNLDRVVHTLDPKFDPNEAIRRYSLVIMQLHMRKVFSSGNIFATVLELKEFAEKLPGRFNQLMETVTSRGLEVKVDAIDEARLIEGIQKVANRITLGLLLAALIIGAALLMRIETSFTILGYPGLAIIFFMLAAGGALVLAFNIIFRDEKKK